VSDYGWFAIKNIAIVAAAAFACWFIQSAWPLLALGFMTSWTGGECKCNEDKNKLNDNTEATT
jgi:hypothetical protein